ncbi:MAG TPA: TPM domain-containing protein, partial [Candidatus Dormibacteraeota bacterium]|nr:TPM domain-containing protein [Candidatus Dormibacteraeota bacterium]
SAEIRVHLDHRCKGDALQKAVAVFERLGMHKTADRHGVLIYVAVTDRKLAVIGDQGIHERVGEDYWRRVVAAVTDHFRNERPREGFLHAVGDVGEMLARHFPRRPGDQNELSDQVSIS